jgi:hypothetical protein
MSSACPDLIDHRDKKGSTALMTASAMSHILVVRRLIESRASVNSPDYKGRTPLIAAVGVGAFDVVEALCAAGANLALAGERGRAALHLAVEYNSAAIVRVLIDHGVNINAQDASCRTPLHIAVEMQVTRCECCFCVVLLLLEIHRCLACSLRCFAAAGGRRPIHSRQQGTQKTNLSLQSHTP